MAPQARRHNAFAKHVLFVGEVPLGRAVALAPVNASNAMQIRYSQNMAKQDAPRLEDSKPLIVDRKPVVQHRPTLQAKMRRHHLPT